MSRSRLQEVSPSLRMRSTPDQAAALREEPAHLFTPGSPSILGPPEAPLLPAEDDEDEDDDDEDIWEPPDEVGSGGGSSRLDKRDGGGGGGRGGRGGGGGGGGQSVRRGAIASPSLRRLEPPARALKGSGSAHSPTLFAGVGTGTGAAPAQPPNLGSAEGGVRLVRVKGRVVEMKRAPCKRESRAARPSEPSAYAVQVCTDIVRRREGELKVGEGRGKLAPDDNSRYRSTTASVSGRGPSAHARREEEQAKINHIAQLKAKNIETHNQAASWLLWGNTAEQCYDQLAESALRSNANNSAICKKKEKQGAAYQTSRIWCKGIGAAAAAQCGNVAIAFGLAEAMMRAKGIDVRSPLATNATDPCLFAEASWMRASREELVGVVSTTQLVYNANPTKVGVGCIMSAARKLSNLELGPRRTISEAMSSSNYMLSAMCKSVGGGYEIDVRTASTSNLHAPYMPSLRTSQQQLLQCDREHRSSEHQSHHRVAWVWQAAWASIVLIVYCTSDPRGRPLLREHTSLTDLDIHTACTLEAYGRGEVTRRARLRATQDAEAAKPAPKRQRRSSTQEPGPSQGALGRQPKGEGGGAAAAGPASAPAAAPTTTAGTGSAFPGPEAYHAPRQGVAPCWPGQDPGVHTETDAERGIEKDSASIVNDDDEYDDDPLNDDLLSTETADQKILATKRKRACKGYASASTADSHGILTW